MSLTIFSKHDFKTRVSISYAEFAWFRSAFACAYDDAIGECYKGWLENHLLNEDVANAYDKKFEEVFKAASVKKKNVMKFLCKPDTKGSAGKAILQEILERKEKIVSSAENYQRKPFELILSVIEKAKDYGIRWG